MDKDKSIRSPSITCFTVSTLVLMDSWIKTLWVRLVAQCQRSFNPCFNGFMDKDSIEELAEATLGMFQPLF